MTTVSDPRISITSWDVGLARAESLQADYPELFADGGLDVRRLQDLFGGLLGGSERYGLSWAGRNNAVAAVRNLTTATLAPVEEESVEFSSTKNFFIEGDNLEVLKILQRSYYGRVKLIYIDPPYNTGNEFIYPDNFQEGLDEYLRYSGQLGEDSRKVSTVMDATGRYHSKWLSMMYPRLYLARNLLCDDGILLVSISDHEVANLTLLLNDIFGEENFIGSLVWKSRQFPDSRAVTRVSTDHEYVLAYSRSSNAGFRGVDRDEGKFRNPDGDSRGPWMSRSILGLATAEQRPNLHYDLVDPQGRVFSPPANTGWRYGKSRMDDLVASGCILFPSSVEGRPREKKFRRDLKDEFVPFPSIIDDVFTSNGTDEVRKLFGFQAFDFPKPSELIRRLVEQTTAGDDLVLDFFAGSATTAHAVWLQNRKDGGRRRFICVQLPEHLRPESELARGGFTSIADVAKERLRRTRVLLRESDNDVIGLGASEECDEGFRVLKLTSSCFHVWDGHGLSAESLPQQLHLFADHVLPGSDDKDILVELLLKTGLTLDVDVAEINVAGQKAYSIAGGLLIVCLANPISQEGLRAVVELRPERLICLDIAFGGNDQLKTNTVLEMKSHGIEFRTV